VRRYLGRSVEPARLARVLEAGRRAASAANRQPWKFVLLTGAAKRAFDPLLRECFREAPAVVVALARPDQAWVRRADGRNYAWVDVAIAVTEMALAATDEGLGSCWVASFDPEEVLRTLGLGEGWEPVTALVLGYAADEPPPGEKPRKRHDEVWEVRA